MKRLVSIALVLLLTGAAFTGCQKDGVYNPKNKISKVYKSVNGFKTLEEQWTWDGNILHNVAYFKDDTTMSYKWYYLYEKKQLVKVENTSNLSYIAITYSGSQYDKVEFFDKFGRKSRTFAYTYDGKKVSKIDATIYKNPQKAMVAEDYDVLSAFIPMEILEETDKQIAKSAPLKSDEDNIINYALTYNDKGNLSEWKITNNNDIKKLQVVVYKYEAYDENKNPFYASYPRVDDGGIGFAPPCFSKNNPTKVSCKVTINSEQSGDVVSYDYSYQYNGKKFPTQVIRKISYSLVPDTFSDTTYYEYTEK